MEGRASALRKKPLSVIARKTKPDVAIQIAVDFIDVLDCFAPLAMTILARFLSVLDQISEVSAEVHCQIDNGSF